MPVYEYSCATCGASFERLLKISQMEDPLAQPCPECEAEGQIDQLVTSAAICDPIRLGIKRPDSGWNDVLGKVKQAHPKGTYQSRFSPTSGR